ncbi:hypothetical protein AMECASPLE_030491 [Ameca splendens]|uniref:Uncharacterized protein n=1 Tax=Ameca splendens TaxID=208324 RepID=A0ABV0ZTP7_9TELE
MSQYWHKESNTLTFPTKDFYTIWDLRSTVTLPGEGKALFSLQNGTYEHLIVAITMSSALKRAVVRGAATMLSWRWPAYKRRRLVAQAALCGGEQRLSQRAASL